MDFWRRKGFAMNPVMVSWSVSKQLEFFKTGKLKDDETAEAKESPQADANNLLPAIAVSEGEEHGSRMAWL